MCRGLTITLSVSFFDKYHVATIPKSRIEFVRFFFFLYMYGQLTRLSPRCVGVWLRETRIHNAHFCCHGTIYHYIILGEKGALNGEIHENIFFGVM